VDATSRVREGMASKSCCSVAASCRGSKRVRFTIVVVMRSSHTWYSSTKPPRSVSTDRLRRAWEPSQSTAVAACVWEALIPGRSCCVRFQGGRGERSGIYESINGSPRRRAIPSSAFKPVGCAWGGGRYPDALAVANRLFGEARFQLCCQLSNSARADRLRCVRTAARCPG